MGDLLGSPRHPDSSLHVAELDTFLNLSFSSTPFNIGHLKDSSGECATGSQRGTKILTRGGDVGVGNPAINLKRQRSYTIFGGRQ